MITSFRARALRPTLAALAAALLLVPLVACSASSGGAPDAMRAEGGMAEHQDGGSSAGDAGGAEAAPDAAADTAAEAGQSIIRTGSISLETKNPSAAAEELAGLAKELDGYVEAQSIDEENEYGPGNGSVVLRVPADSFDQVFERIGSIGTVTSQTRSAVDVTAQHVDLQARVRALEASVERLTELMAGADSTADLLEAESALSQRQQELDGLQAQLQALEDQVGYATVEVFLAAEGTALPGGPGNFWEGLLAGLDSIATAGAAALVVAGVLLPWLLLLGVVAVAVLLIVRAAKRRRSRRPAPVSAPTPRPVAPGTVTAPHSSANATDPAVYPNSDH